MLLVVMKEVSVLSVINVPLRSSPPQRTLRRTTYTVRKANLSSIWDSWRYLGYSNNVLG